MKPQISESVFFFFFPTVELAEPEQWLAHSGCSMNYSDINKRIWTDFYSWVTVTFSLENVWVGSTSCAFLATISRASIDM